MSSQKAEKPAGDSSEQREAEQWLLGELSAKLGAELSKKKLRLSNGGYLELDGFCESPPIFCEIWAHVGSVKGAQPKKVMTDALKLIFARRILNKSAKCILLFADHLAASRFQGTSWMAECLFEHEISIEVIELPEELTDKVQNAQDRQFR